VALVRNDVSEEHITFTIGVRRIRLLVTVNIVLSSLILFHLIMKAKCSSETSELARATLSDIPEDGILNNLI
jgi:hypothetical protein